LNRDATRTSVDPEAAASNHKPQPPRRLTGGRRHTAANTSTQWRRGLTIRYIPTSTRILDAEASSAFLLRAAPCR